MPAFDPSQLRAIELDVDAHARVLGAPGSGKTRVLVEVYRRAIERPGWGENDVIAIAPNRLVASDLRARFERSIGRAIGGTPVRTAASLGFAILSREHARAGIDAPRLLTGTVQDELLAEVIAESGVSGRAAAFAHTTGLVPEVLATPAFRAELRDLARILDDFDRSPAELVAELAAARDAAAGAAFSEGPGSELVERWAAALALLEEAAQRAADRRPGELSSSAMLRAASAAVREHGVRSDAEPGDGFAVPRLILIDDAQELGEGALSLLAACAAVGSSVWAFGDPDTATGAFQGERSGMLSGVATTLARRQSPGVVRATQRQGAAPESRVTLATVHRHGTELRGFVQSVTARIGAAGAGSQREANAHETETDPAAVPARAAVQFARVGSPAEQLGVIAHRFRARHLGLDGGVPLHWGDMAVVCRSRSEATRVARALAVHQVPTGIAAGGLVLREHRIVRELIRLLQHALGIASLTADDILQLVGGVVGGLDPVAVRRLRGALVLLERREAAAANRAPASIDELVREAVAFPGATPLIDSAGGRVLRRIGLIAQSATRVREAGGTAREVLWAIWDGTRLSRDWQEDALAIKGARADEANRSLDAVMALFFALQRHEEQDSAQPIEALLSDLLESAVPEDSLARRSERTSVTVTTPQGAIGREFDIVALIGAQDGAWPNLRSRGSLLGTTALERWLLGGAAAQPSRRDTMHDELRLFAHSCARARRELLVVAVADEQQYPSAFFGFGRDHLVEGLPSTRLTLRGQVAAMRRRAARDVTDTGALRALVALADAEVPGAHPDDWYGVMSPSTAAPLIDLDGDPDARVRVSPSQLERAENCPLDWAVSSLGGGAGSVQASLGTLLHHAFEVATEPDAEQLFAAVRDEWGKLPFAAEWESERTERLARAMTAGLADYLREFEGSDRTLLGREAMFRATIDRAELRGVADRLEQRENRDGEMEITVLDLKTGRTPPSKVAAQEHAQLQAYQLGVLLGAFEIDSASEQAEVGSEPSTSESHGLGHEHEREHDSEPVSGGARLLYVHPDAAKGAGFVERVQQPISDEAREAFTTRVSQIARVMAAGTFTARVEHHCSDPHQPGSCRLHVIPSVSHA
ncbi:PD-(D/E)XK nuclease family protein [Leucobacter sp. NPDC058333]|uniref:PD-(D/E)XK nuclease family protein n=1 Tax=Leucobacter sp. NPDC058333 TaxID=3346450 RepID=UPI0036616F9E